MDSINKTLRKSLATSLDVAGWASGERLRTRFSIATLKVSLDMARECRLLNNVEWLMGKQLNIAILDSPIGIYNALSVGIFAARLLINAIDIAHRMIIPEQIDLDNHLTSTDIFWQEIDKKQYFIVNDSVWGIVNALCNYAAFFGIPLYLPNILMVAFTGFDIFWLNQTLKKLDKGYEAKIKAAIDQGASDEAVNALRKEHEVNRTPFLFYMTGSSLMLNSFVLGFLFLPPSYLPVCLLVCNMSIAMYFCSSEFTDFYLKYKVDNPTPEQQAATNEALYNLGCALTKKTVMPLLLIGLFTTSATAAVVLTAAYIAWETDAVNKTSEYVKSWVPSPGF